MWFSLLKVGLKTRKNIKAAAERFQHARLVKLELFVYALEIGCEILKNEELCTNYDCFL